MIADSTSRTEHALRFVFTLSACAGSGISVASQDTFVAMSCVAALAVAGVLLGHIVIGTTFEIIAARPRQRMPVVPTGDGVVQWVNAYHAKHGRVPAITDVQTAFPAIPRTTAWRRIKQARAA